MYYTQKRLSMNNDLAAELLTYEQAAAWLGIGVEKLRKMVYAGAVRCVRFGHRTVRFRPVDLDRATAAMTVNAVGEEVLDAYRRHHEGLQNFPGGRRMGAPCAKK